MPDEVSGTHLKNEFNLFMIRNYLIDYQNSNSVIQILPGKAPGEMIVELSSVEETNRVLKVGYVLISGSKYPVARFGDTNYGGTTNLFNLLLNDLAQ